MTSHQQKIQEYRALGGSEKEIQKLLLPSLQNRARLLYILKELKGQQSAVGGRPTAESRMREATKYIPRTDGHRLLGLVSQYPTELHETYQVAFAAWIQACSLKIQLNEVSLVAIGGQQSAVSGRQLAVGSQQLTECRKTSPLPPSKGEYANGEKRMAESSQQLADSIFALQLEIFSCFEIFNKGKKILDYYNKEKRIMPTKTKSDFSKLSPLQLLQKRNNLRGLISRRKATIEKKAQELPPKNSPLYQKRLAMLNKKNEELQSLILDLEKVDALLK